MWIGLDALHTLTNQRDYGLKIVMFDWDESIYVAFYDHFKVGHIINHVILCPQRLVQVMVIS